MEAKKVVRRPGKGWVVERNSTHLLILKDSKKSIEVKVNEIQTFKR